MMKHYNTFKNLCFAILLAAIFFPGISKAQNFTIIDTLPDGAYGAAAWGDFDNDGFKDLAFLTQTVPFDICKIYHNVNNTFIEVSQYFPMLYNPSVNWADLNNDSFDDLVMNGMDSTATARTFIYQSNGNGTFTSITNSIPGLSAGSVALADYNNDGLIDIAVTGNDSLGFHHAYIFKNMGGFNFTDINATLFGTHFGEMQWGDYDNDSLPDLVINGIGDTDFRVRIYKNMGSDIFQLQPFYMKGSGGTVDWVDYDSDGWLDILVTGYDSTSVHNFTQLHHNNANGTFILDTTNIPPSGEPSGVAIADFNNDGNKDVVIIGGVDLNPFNGSLYATGQGSGIFNLQPFFNGNIQFSVTETADIDNDGDYDLIFGRLILRNDLITGIKQSSTVSPVLLYPNPAGDVIHINSKIPIKSVSIFDVSGRQIQSTFNFLNPTEINLVSLENGIYVFELLTANNELFHHTVSVQH